MYAMSLRDIGEYLSLKTMQSRQLVLDIVFILRALYKSLSCLYEPR